MKILFQLALIFGITVGSHARDCSTPKPFRVKHPQQLSGVLLDPNGVFLPGIRIQLRRGKTVIKDLRTNHRGEYNFGEIVPGTYRIWIASGDHDFCAPEVHCQARGCSVNARIKLNPKHTVVIK